MIRCRKNLCHNRIRSGKSLFWRFCGRNKLQIWNGDSYLPNKNKWGCFAHWPFDLCMSSETLYNAAVFEWFLGPQHTLPTGKMHLLKPVLNYFSLEDALETFYCPDVKMHTLFTQVVGSILPTDWWYWTLNKHSYCMMTDRQSWAERNLLQEFLRASDHILKGTGETTTPKEDMSGAHKFGGSQGCIILQGPL